MKNSTLVTITKRRVRLSVTSIKRTFVGADPVEPDMGPSDRDYEDNIGPTISSPTRGVELSDGEDDVERRLIS